MIWARRILIKVFVLDYMCIISRSPKRGKGRHHNALESQSLSRDTSCRYSKSTNSLNTKNSDLIISLLTQPNEYDPTVSVCVRVEAYNTKARNGTRLPVYKENLHQARWSIRNVSRWMAFPGGVDLPVRWSIVGPGMTNLALGLRTVSERVSRRKA